MRNFSMLNKTKNWDTITPSFTFDPIKYFDELIDYIGSPMYAKNNNNGLGLWVALLIPSNEQKEIINKKIYESLCSKVVKYTGLLNESWNSAKNLSDHNFIKKHPEAFELVFKANAYLNNPNEKSVYNYDIIKMAIYEGYLFDEYNFHRNTKFTSLDDSYKESLGNYREDIKYIACLPVEDLFFCGAKNIISIDDLEDVPAFGIHNVEECYNDKESFYVYNIGLYAYGFEEDDITYCLKVDYTKYGSLLHKSDMFIRYGSEEIY